MISLMALTFSILFLLVKPNEIQFPEAFVFAVVITAIISSYAYYELKSLVLERMCIGLVLISFVFAYPLSAVIHLWRPESDSRGFFDLVQDTGNNTLIWPSLGLVALALIAMVIGIKKQNKIYFNSYQKISLVPRKIYLIFGLTLIMLGFYSNIVLFGSLESTISHMQVIDRNTEIGGGIARYFFFTRWLSWGLFALLGNVLLENKSKHKILFFFILTVVFSLVNTFWGGGRVDGILATLPSLILLYKYQKVLLRASFLILLFSLIPYIFFVTYLRSSQIGTDNLLLEVFDWQAGRFSMSGLAIAMVNEDGYAWGSTLFSEIIKLINAPFYLFSHNLLFKEIPGITNYCGRFLKGDIGLTGIVPGAICELYYNFGIIGVFTGFYFIGRFTVLVSRFVGAAKTVGSVATSSYLLVLICTAIIPGTIFNWIYHFFTLGFPAIALVIFEKFYSSRVLK